MTHLSTTPVFDVHATLRLLESSDLQASTNARTALQTQLSSDESPYVLHALLEHYLVNSSNRALDLIINIRESQCKKLFERLNDALSTRSVACITLLAHLILRQPPWFASNIATSILLHNVVKLVKTSQNVTYVVSALLFLSCLLPLLVTSVPIVQCSAKLDDFMHAVFRVMQWLFGDALPSEHRHYVYVALYALFSRIYYLYPISLVGYLRVEFSREGEERLKMFEQVVRPMLHCLRLHPVLIMHTRDWELQANRFKHREAHDIVMECSQLMIDNDGGVNDEAIGDDQESAFAHSVATSFESSFKLTPLYQSTATTAVSDNAVVPMAISLPTTAHQSRGKQMESLWSPSDALGLSTPPSSRSRSPTSMTASSHPFPSSGLAERRSTLSTQGVSRSNSPAEVKLTRRSSFGTNLQQPIRSKESRHRSESSKHLVQQRRSLSTAVQRFFHTRSSQQHSEGHFHPRSSQQHSEGHFDRSPGGSVPSSPLKRHGGSTSFFPSPIDFQDTEVCEEAEEALSDNLQHDVEVQRYHVHYDVAPQHYDVAPQHYDVAPQHYDVAPQHYDVAPQHYDAAPQGDVHYNVAQQHDVDYDVAPQHDHAAYMPPTVAISLTKPSPGGVQESQESEEVMTVNVDHEAECEAMDVELSPTYIDEETRFQIRHSRFHSTPERVATSNYRCSNNTSLQPDIPLLSTANSVQEYMSTVNRRTFESTCKEEDSDSEEESNLPIRPRSATWHSSKKANERRSYTERKQNRSPSSRASDRDPTSPPQPKISTVVPYPDMDVYAQQKSQSREVIDDLLMRVLPSSGRGTAASHRTPDSTRTYLSPHQILDEYLHDRRRLLEQTLAAPQDDATPRKMAEEGVVGLRIQINLLHQQLLYERYRRQMHAQRNRRLFARLRQHRVNEDMIANMRADIRLLDTERNEFMQIIPRLRKDNRAEQDELKRKITVLEGENAGWAKRSGEQMDALEEVKRREVNLKDAMNKLRDDAGELRQKLLEAELDLEKAQEGVEHSSSLAQEKDFLSHQLRVAVDVNRAMRGELQMRLAGWKETTLNLQIANQQLTNARELHKKELAELRRSLRKERSRADQTTLRMKELESSVGDMQSLLGEMRTRQESARHGHKEHVAALQMKYSALTQVCQRQEAHILQLYADRAVSPNREKKKSTSAEDQSRSIAIAASQSFTQPLAGSVGSQHSNFYLPALFDPESSPFHTTTTTSSAASSLPRSCASERRPSAPEDADVKFVSTQ